jgi:hypothetical protein
VAFTEGAGISLAGQLTAVTVAGNTATATGPAGSSVMGGGVAQSTSLANTIIAWRGRHRSARGRSEQRHARRL